ncbi:MAG: hypothetical protein D6806_12115, partial [Deltaproteobacteria bacterium]
MKVVFLNSRLSQLGGADRWLIDLVSLLRQRGIDTFVVAGHDDGSLEPHERKSLGPTAIFRGLDRGRPGRPARPRRHEALLRLLDEVKPDVVNINDVVEPSAIAAVAGEFPTVFTVQDHRFFCPGPGRMLPDGTACENAPGQACLSCFSDSGYGRYMLELTLERLEALKRALHFVVLSRYMARQLSIAGVPSEKTSVVPPGISVPDPEIPPPTESGRTGRGQTLHLFAARLCRHKGIDTACEAAEMLPEGHR